MDDLSVLVALWSDPAVTRYIGGPRDRDLVANHFRAYAADPALFRETEGEWWWAVVEPASGSLVGLCSLIEKAVGGRLEIELGYYLLPAHWGHGYATEAAAVVAEFARSHLGATSLVAVIGPENAASIRVACKLGMVREREELRCDGTARRVYRLRTSVGLVP